MTSRIEQVAATDVAFVEVERVDLNDRGHVAALVRFNRADQLNAISADVMRALSDALAQQEADDDVRTVLITGRGRAFSAGGDIKAYAKLQTDAEAFTTFVDDYCALIERIGAMSKPVVALVNGLCAAGGLELVVGCDFAWAAESARIGDMHINFAQIGGAGALARTPRLIGSARALELVLSGRMLSAREAYEWGVVNRVVADDQLIEDGIGFARSVAEKSPTAIDFMKKTVRAGLAADLGTALRIERDRALEYCLTLPDSMEGITAFIEKRAPVFRMAR
jgi:enoyl-CoA hydratase/carnithine racemase